VDSPVDRKPFNIASYALLTLKPSRQSIFDFEFEDFQITGYDPLPTIKAEIAV
jgi:thymidylate synthase